MRLAPPAPSAQTASIPAGHHWGTIQSHHASRGSRDPSNSTLHICTCSVHLPPPLPCFNPFSIYPYTYPFDHPPLRLPNCHPRRLPRNLAIALRSLLVARSRAGGWALSCFGLVWVGVTFGPSRFRKPRRTSVVPRKGAEEERGGWGHRNTP